MHVARTVYAACLAGALASALAVVLAPTSDLAWVALPAFALAAWALAAMAAPDTRAHPYAIALLVSGIVLAFGAFVAVIPYQMADGARALLLLAVLEGILLVALATTLVSGAALYAAWRDEHERPRWDAA